MTELRKSALAAPYPADFASAARALVAVGERLGGKGLAPATAGNYSMRLTDGSIAITVSGAHKAHLSTDQVMRVDAAGEPLDGKRPSAETLLHCLVYAQDAAAGAVLHTHSVAGTVLSRAIVAENAIRLHGFEMAKIYPGTASHDTAIAMPLVDNSQDMPVLAATLRPILAAQAPPLPAFYIRGHGLYAWGPSLEAAEHIVEASEFLLACAWEELKLQGSGR